MLAGVGFFTHAVSAIAYYIAGKHYVAFDKHIKYRSILARGRKERGYDK